MSAAPPHVLPGGNRVHVKPERACQAVGCTSGASAEGSKESPELKDAAPTWLEHGAVGLMFITLLWTLWAKAVAPNQETLLGNVSLLEILVPCATVVLAFAVNRRVASVARRIFSFPSEVSAAAALRSDVTKLLVRLEQTQADVKKGAQEDVKHTAQMEKLTAQMEKHTEQIEKLSDKFDAWITGATSIQQQLVLQQAQVTERISKLEQKFALQV